MTTTTGHLTDTERESLLSVTSDLDAIDAVERIVAAREAAAVEAARAAWADPEYREARDRAAVEAALAPVRALAEGWVGFDDSHHYGDAVLKLLPPAPTEGES